MFETVVDVQDYEDCAQFTEQALLEFRADVHRFFRLGALKLARADKRVAICFDYTGDLLRCSLHEFELDYRLEVVAEGGRNDRRSVLSAISSELRRVRRQLRECLEAAEDGRQAVESLVGGDRG